MTNTNIQIVDSVMGSGKTTSIIDYINSCSNPIIIIVERQSEVERLSSACPNLIALSDVSEEENITRRDALEYSASKGKSIVSTHHLFNFWKDCFLNDAKKWCYELIIDETLSGVLTEISIRSDDLRKYVDDGYIEVCAASKLNKIKLTRSLHSKYSDVENKITNKDCYLFNITNNEDNPHYMLIEAPRSEMFCVFNKIKVLTYKFSGSLLKCYFDLHNISYQLTSIYDGKMGVYVDPQGKSFKEKLHVYNGKWNHRRGQDIGTQTWIEKKNNQKAMKNRLRNVFNCWKNYGVTSENFLYTTHKDYQKAVHPDQIRGLKNKLNETYACTRKRLNMSEEDQRNVSFVSQTIRGTNDFSHKKFMAFTGNTFLYHQINYFLKYHNVSIDEEVYALNRMIQWLWRGCIRNDQEMYVYIPSRRMRHLFLKWLGYTEAELF